MFDIISHQENANQDCNIMSHPRGWLYSKTWTVANIGSDVEKLEFSCIASGKAKNDIALWKSLAVPYKVKDTLTAMD